MASSAPSLGRRGTALLLVALGLAVNTCGRKSDPGQIDPCDPGSNVYEKDGKHFIDSDMVREDGTLDYGKIFELNKAESSPCDPLRKRDAKGPKNPAAP